MHVYHTTSKLRLDRGCARCYRLLAPSRHWTRIAARLSLSTTAYLLVIDPNRVIPIDKTCDNPTFFFQGSDLCVHFLYLQSLREFITRVKNGSDQFKETGCIEADLTVTF
jgi:hypothetical protein